jgi:allophanate hydrolase subunit 2
MCDDILGAQEAHGGGTLLQVPQEGTPIVSMPRAEGQGTYGSAAVQEAMMVARLFYQRAGAAGYI